MHLLRVSGDQDVWREAYELGSKHIEAVAAGEVARIADEFLPYWIGGAAWRAMPESRRAAIIETMPAVAQFWVSEFAEETPPESYSELPTPTLLIRGARTRATARDIVELLASLIPKARIVEIEGAGHMAPLTHIDEVNSIIEQHIVANSNRP